VIRRRQRKTREFAKGRDPHWSRRPLPCLLARTGLCSYRVIGVDGSRAEHLTVESYTVVICQQSYLLLSVFHIPLTLSFQA